MTAGATPRKRTPGTEKRHLKNLARMKRSEIRGSRTGTALLPDYAYGPSGLRHSMRLEERGVSGVGAIQCRLAVAAHHHVEHEIVAVFIGIHPERADLETLLRLAGIFEDKAQEGGLAVCALDRRQLADLRSRIGGEQAL